MITGLEAKRFGKTATHNLSQVQLVAGSDSRIHQGISLARYAIQQAGKSKVGCGLLDLDFMAGFDWMVMAWVYKVSLKNGVCMEVISRLQRIFASSYTVVVVNNLLGMTFSNIRESLRQGDIPSMFFFGVSLSI